METDISSSTPQPNLFAIPPPDLSGSGYTNLVVDNNGVPIGQNSSDQTVSAMLGYSSKDTMGAAVKDIVEMANMLNLGLSIPRGTIEQSILAYLDNLDPSTPGLPPIKTLIVLLQRELAAGKLGNSQIQEQSDDQFQSTAHETAAYNKNADQTGTSTFGINQQATVDQQQDTGDGSTGSDSSNDQTGADGTAAGQTTLQLNAQLNPVTGTANDQTTAGAAPGPANAGGAPGPTSVAANASNEDQLNAMQNNIDVIRDANANANVGAGKTVVTVGKTSGGNEFLAGNAYIAFLISFMEMQRIMMKSKAVENNIETISMNLTWTLAQQTASAIMKIAYQNFAVHIASAVMAGVSLAITAAGALFALKGSGMMKSQKIGPDGKGMFHTEEGPLKGKPIMVHQQHAGYMRLSEILTGVGGSLSQMGQNLAQAATDLTTAQLEGAKELLQAIRQLIQMQLQKAGDAIKSQEDLITQELQTLSQMANSLEQAISNALRR
jgi:hypothetical protein